MSLQTFSKIGEGCYCCEIFRSLLAEDSKGYSKTEERMKKLVSQQAGFLEFSSVREEALGIRQARAKNLTT